jgi:hypothetical protein
MLHYSVFAEVGLSGFECDEQENVTAGATGRRNNGELSIPFQS